MWMNGDVVYRVRREEKQDQLRQAARWRLLREAGSPLFHDPPFVGRKRELAVLAEEWDRAVTGESRTVAITGAAGIGKTRLAYQATRDLDQLFADGVHFIPLAALASPEFLIFTIASALKIPYYDQEQPSDLVVNYLRSKTALLVLDNFEHLVSGASLLAHIAVRCPGVKLMVTSREKLNLRAEVVYPVEGLEYPLDGERVPGATYSALELFIERARPPSKSEKESCAPACQRLICMGDSGPYPM